MMNFPTTTSEVSETTCPKVLPEKGRVDQHAHRHKEQDRKGFAEGKYIRADLMAERRDWLMMAPATKAPSASETPNKLRCAHGDAQGDGQDRQDEQLTRAGVGDAFEQPGNQPNADKEHDHHKRGGFEQGDRQATPSRNRPRWGPGRA